jgi:pimeloyl-ACP methyl ester carboxylesterase
MHPQPSLRTTHVTASPKNLLVYDRWGQFGRPVVLLHGLMFDRTMWWPVAAELAGAACTVIAPDLPGHGQSPPRQDYRVERIADDLAGLVNALGLHRAPVVVGHAASALLATAFADAYATHHVLTLDEPTIAASTIEDLVTTAGLDAVPEALRPYAAPRTDPALLRAYESWLAQPPTRRNQPAMAGRTPALPSGPAGPLAHLTDPRGFAAELRALL